MRAGFVHYNDEADAERLIEAVRALAEEATGHGRSEREAPASAPLAQRYGRRAPRPGLVSPPPRERRMK